MTSATDEQPTIINPPGMETDVPVARSRALNARQVEAVYAVMRLLRNDRSADAADETITCDACHRERASGGSVSYGARILCNGCATDYELLSVARTVRGLDDFLGLAQTLPARE